MLTSVSITKERNYGIDVLRIVSMWMIIVVHILAATGLLKARNQELYDWAWLLEILCISGVNCFAMISGYCDRGHSFTETIRRMILMWAGIAFYTIPCEFMRIIITKQYDMNSIKMMFPFASNRYWYFNAYFVVAILVSLLKPELEKLDAHSVGLLISGSIFLVCATDIVGGDALNLSNGYSAIWLLICYIWGNGLRRFDEYNYIDKGIEISIGIIGYITVSLIIVFLKLKCGIDKVSVYTSPLVILQTVFLIVFFKNWIIRSNNTKVIVEKIKPAVFGVYIIHFESLIWAKIVMPFCNIFLEINGIPLLACIMVLAVIIEMICIFVELCRLKLFDLMLKY